MSNAIFEMKNENCTCCGDVIKLIEFKGDETYRGFSLYKTLITSIERSNNGWCYFLLIDDDKFPIVITEEAANSILQKPNRGHTLAYNRFFDRYR